MARFRDFQHWFATIQQVQQANAGRHPNQETYDLTVGCHNYQWPFCLLPEVNAQELGGGGAEPSPYVPLVHDIGCAYGSLAIGARLKGYRVMAWDITDQYVSKAALKALGVCYGDLNIENDHPAEVKDNKADIVIFTEVLEHLNGNPQDALYHIRQCMKDGGTLILSTPRLEDGRHDVGVFQKDGIESWRDIPVLDSRKSWVDAHTYIYTCAEVNDLLDTMGFRVVHTATFWDGLSYGVQAIKERE